MTSADLSQLIACDLDEPCFSPRGCCEALSPLSVGQVVLLPQCDAVCSDNGYASPVRELTEWSDNLVALAGRTALSLPFPPLWTRCATFSRRLAPLLPSPCSRSTVTFLLSSRHMCADATRSTLLSPPGGSMNLLSNESLLSLSAVPALTSFVFTVTFWQACRSALYTFAA